MTARAREVLGRASTQKSIILSIVILLSILYRPHAAEHTIAEELNALPEESCMSTPQLHEAVMLASWTATVKGVPRAAVIITSCNLECLKELFEPFIKSIEGSRDGDFSQHLIIVGNTLAAYLHCNSLRHYHKHRCVLDRMCPPPNSGDVTNHTSDPSWSYGKGMYFFSLLQKVTWAAEVVKLGVSVMWTDMDISFFQNPLPFIFNAAPDADFVIQSEYWDDTNVFTGDVCNFTRPSAGCISDVQWRAEGRPPTSTNHSSHLHGVCCNLNANGGLWLANPTLKGRRFLEVWTALLFENSVVQKRMWDGSATLDQAILGHLMWNGRSGSLDAIKAPLYRWDKEQKQYILYGEVWRSVNPSTNASNEIIYRISAQRCQSHCFGLCGWMGSNIAYNSYQKDGHLVCVMPKRYAERLVSFHQNCCSDIKVKRQNMMLLLNMTYDEERYEAERKEQKRTVFPDWVQ